MTDKVELQDAIKRVGNLHFPMALAARHSSPLTLLEMLTDLEMAVQNAKAIAMVMLEGAPDSL